jgi:hypothetical protein
MASRSRAGGIGIQAFLNETQSQIATLDEHSPKDLVDIIMDRELIRLKEFMNSAVIAAENILQTGLVQNLVFNSSYYPPHHSFDARPVVGIRPSNNYFLRFIAKELLDNPNFNLDEILPQSGLTRAVMIEAEVVTPYHSQTQSKFDLQFGVNNDDTITAFKWLLQEWRRPIGQLLRGLPNLEVWENGRPVEAPKDQRTKDPATLLQHYLSRPKPAWPNTNLFSLQSSFSAEDIDQDVEITFAVFLSFFDAVYRLTTERSDPDRLLRHYQALVEHLPKTPFRATTIFPKECI